MIRLAGLQRFAAPLGSMKKGSGSGALRCLHSALTSEPRDHDLTNGDALCLGLRAAGVSAVFGIPGTHMNAFYHCLQRLSELGEAELRSEVNIELNFSPKLRGARSRLYRRRFLQVNTRWKALAEIYTMHSFAPFSWDPSG